MDLSIIIVSYNTKTITQKCLDTIISSLEKTILHIEIIVVDNNSQDGTIEMLQGYEKRITKNYKNFEFTFIESNENLGFVKANNLAAKKAKAETLLFLNSDIEVLDKAIIDLYNYYEGQHEFQFVGGKLFNKDMTPQASCGPEYNLLNIFIFLFLRGDYIGVTRSSPNDVKEVAWVSGACFITDKKYFDSLHGFDEKIFMYMEEIDLFFRAKKSGHKIGFYPKSHFVHLGSASSSGRTEPILQVYKGYLYFYKKNFSSFSLVILKIMLQLKAVISISIAYVLRLMGKSTKAEYLSKTYEEANAIAKNY